jgi:hypothetical protein
MSFLIGVFSFLKYYPTLLETLGLRLPNLNLETSACLMLTLNVESVLPLDSLRQQMPSTVMLIHSMNVRFRLI